MLPSIALIVVVAAIIYSIYRIIVMINAYNANKKAITHEYAPKNFKEFWIGYKKHNPKSWWELNQDEYDAVEESEKNLWSKRKEE